MNINKENSLLDMKSFNKSIIKEGATIQVKGHVLDLFYTALGISKDEVNKVSSERLNKLAGGFFLANHNPHTNTFKDITTNFSIPDKYHLEEIHKKYITISRYSHCKEGFKDLKGVNINAYEKAVSNVKLGYDDFYIMGSSL